MLGEAARAERQTRAASRWFARYFAATGVLAFALIVAIEVFFPSASPGCLRGPAGRWRPASWERWAESHDVYPQGAGRRLFIAAAVWFSTYLFLIGPLVRWQAGTSLAWWSLAAAVMASPFLVGAWWEGRRA